MHAHTHTHNKSPPTNQKGQTGNHTIHWLSGNENVPGCIEAQSEDQKGGLYPDGLFFSPQQPAASRDELYSPFLSRTAASRAHPSLFPTPCRRFSSASSALINLITNRRTDPRPIYLSTYVYPGCLYAFGPDSPTLIQQWLRKYQIYFMVCYLNAVPWYHATTLLFLSIFFSL